MCSSDLIDRYNDYYNGWNETDEYKLFELLDSFKGKFVLTTWHSNKYRENVYIEKLWNKFISENNINPIKTFDKIKCPYTNFMVMNIEFFKNNTVVKKILKEIEESHGIYSNRWGDLPIWGMILSTLIDETHYFENKNISYFHASHNKTINK